MKLPPVPDKTNKNKPVCSYYRKGQCRHGISGKGCTRAHPTLCRKLMNSGTKGPRGCTKGKDCDRFHPKMCPSSISHRECLNDLCSMYHVKGTQRLNSRQQPSKVLPQSPNPQDKQTEHQKKQPLNPGADPQEAFLEMLRDWKKEIMVTIDQKIQEACSRTPTPAAPPTHLLPYHPQGHPTGHLIPPGTVMMQGYPHPHRY